MITTTRFLVAGPAVLRPCAAQIQQLQKHKRHAPLLNASGRSSLSHPGFGDPLPACGCSQTQVAKRLLQTNAVASQKTVAPASQSKPRAKQNRRNKDDKKWKSSTRASIVRQLLRIQEEGAYAALVSGSVSAEGQESESRDSRQITYTVSNIVRWQRRLDFLIAHLTGKPCERLETIIHAILRLAVHELVFQGLQAHAVSEHVNLAKTLVRPAAGGLVNAVLRRLLREQEAGTLPEPPLPSPGTPPQQAADMLAVATSHPTWMVQRWLQRWGQEDTLALLHHNNRSAPAYAVRVTPGRNVTPDQLVQNLQEAGVEGAVSSVLPGDFLVVNGLQHLIRQGFLERGDCQVQDEAAGLVVALLDPQPGESVLDACAAPGGKALFAASRMQAQGTLVAMDINKRRLNLLKTAAAAQGVQDLIKIQNSDVQKCAADAAAQTDAKTQQQQQQQQQFDRVLVDAPCSGSGVLAKRVDLRWRRTPQELTELVALQARLLDAAATLVKPGGLLVYSTCSIETEENADQITAFLSRHPDYTAEACPDGLLPGSCINADGFLQTLPHVHNMDGAFGARLRRTQ